MAGWLLIFAGILVWVLGGFVFSIVEVGADKPVISRLRMGALRALWASLALIALVAFVVGIYSVLSVEDVYWVVVL